MNKVSGWVENPRGINDEDLNRLKKQIQDLGVYKPLIGTKALPEDNAGEAEYIIIGGNMRLKALAELRTKEIEVSVVEADSKEARIKYSLSDNDRAGSYLEDRLVELVNPFKDIINLEDFKVDLGYGWGLKGLCAGKGDNDPNAEWKGMPEFKQDDIYQNAITCIVRFQTEEALYKFEKFLGWGLSHKGKVYSTWFPQSNFDQLGKDLKFTVES
jgi:hypothetical protein